MDFLNSKDFYYKTAIVTIIVIFSELVLGSYVKSIGAGLSCPDWPLCYGEVIPINHFNRYVWSEYLHRVTASVVSILIVVLAYLTFIHRNEMTNQGFQIGQRRLKLMVLILCLLAIQVILGGLTVIYQVNPDIVTSHLAVGTLIFGSTIFLFTKIDPQVGKNSLESL